MSSNSTMYRQLGTVGWIIIAMNGVLQMIDGSLIAGATGSVSRSYAQRF